MNHHTRIFIVGHPGAGKALFAKTLADKLGWQFIDADVGLEYRVGLHINDMLGQDGVQHYLACQHNILKSLEAMQHIVVATDACVVDDDRICKLLSSELTIHLGVKTPVQMERLVRSPMPLVDGDVKVFLDQLHKQRDDLFGQVARFEIDGSEGDLDHHISNVLDRLHDLVRSHDANEGVQLDRKDYVVFHKQTHEPVYLTGQQAACLKLLSQGNSSKEIAQQLGISYRTVEAHVAKMMEQAGCHSNKDLLAIYLNNL